MELAVEATAPLRGDDAHEKLGAAHHGGEVARGDQVVGEAYAGKVGAVLVQLEDFLD
jgi:hypothetical protein